DLGGDLVDPNRPLLALPDPTIGPHLQTPAKATWELAGTFLRLDLQVRPDLGEERLRQYTRLSHPGRIRGLPQAARDHPQKHTEAEREDGERDNHLDQREAGFTFAQPAFPGCPPAQWATCRA